MCITDRRRTSVERDFYAFYAGTVSSSFSIEAISSDGLLCRLESCQLTLSNMLTRVAGPGHPLPNGIGK
ncbi:hypothetical protein AC579_7698 [Pseudocercospora musae]|uniref:Uncharacterized protein n=1 Tax=Pseudocercospora musae TaxID=113226 RepID=A0A139IUA1_9PEZI|nr:hypothetical protein AC579_7698 [Pseudocercospora musae]